MAVLQSKRRHNAAAAATTTSYNNNSISKGQQGQGRRRRRRQSILGWWWLRPSAAALLLFVLLALACWLWPTIITKVEDEIPTAPNENENKNENSFSSSSSSSSSPSCYRSFTELTQEEIHPVAGKRHIVTPPSDHNHPTVLVCCRTTKGPWSIVVSEQLP